MAFSKDKIIIHPLNIILLFIINTSSLKTKAGMSIGFTEPLIFFILILSLSLLIFYIFKKQLKDQYKASLMLSFTLLLILFFRDMVEFTIYFGVSDVFPFIGENLIVIMLAILFLIILTEVLKRSGYKLVRLNAYLNLLTAIFLTIEILGCSFSKTTKVLIKEKIELNVPDSVADAPDIYFILLDGYTGFKGLKILWDYDNSKLKNFFDEKNIFFAKNGRSVYNVTNYSMVSTFYMSELLFNYEDLYAKENYLLLGDYMKNNPVNNFFYKAGYDFYNLTFWNVNNKDKFYEDIYFLRRGNVYQSRTLFGHLYEIYNEKFADMAEINPEIFRKVIDIHRSDNNKPKFIYAHITMPHPPYYFDAMGNRKDFVYSNDKKNMDKYLEQLKYTNTLLMNTISGILDSNKNSVIIVQSDHGFRSYEGKDKSEIEYSVLNSFYFPDGDYSLLNDSSKTINTFRIIFNKYFNQKLELIN